jgi:hypothetical protein
MLRSRLARTTTAALIGLAAAAASLTAGGVTGELVRPLPQGRLVRPDRARLRPWVSYTGSAAPAYGTAPSWSTGPLTAPLNIVGVPTLDVQFSAPTVALTQLAGPAGQLQVFAKLYDVRRTARSPW